MKRGAFRIFLNGNILKNANILGGRFVLAIKNYGTDDEVFKACFVVNGHTDAEKNLLVHCSTNMKQQSLRLLVEMAAVFRLGIWTQDVFSYVSTEL